MTSAPPSRLADLARVIHREIVLLVVLSAIAAGGFLVTRWAAVNNRVLQSSDAMAWFDRGRRQRISGRTAEAVAALERAVARRPDDWTYARTLAEALLADGQTRPARGVLLRWRQARPEDAEVNTSLARLEASTGDVTTAVQYYESALVARWPEPAVTSRADLRRELIRFELQNGLTGSALSHVLILAATAPDDPATHLETGRLFLAAGDTARAADHFERALRLDPANVPARAAATETAFALGNYTAVLAHARGLTDRPSRDYARMAAAVISTDPLEPHLTFGERQRRLGGAVAYAGAQFGACQQRAPNATPLAERTATALGKALAAFAADLARRRPREAPDVTERGLRLADQALEYVRDHCPPLEERGEVALRVTRRHGASE